MTDIVKPLQPIERYIAYLDAQGMTRRQIADIAKCDPARITRLRTRQPYIEERDRLIVESQDRLDPLVKSLKTDYAAAIERAREVLIDAMEAVDGEGRPIHATRVAAAKVTIESPIAKVVVDPKGTTTAPVLAAASAVMKIQIVQHVDGSEEVIIDGEGEEIHDELGPGDRDVDGEAGADAATAGVPPAAEDSAAETD